MKLYKSPFWRDFSHLNVAMWTSNNALVPDPDKEDILASKPEDWPFLKLGLRMCGWGDNMIKFYLLGTPIIWWWSSFSLALSLGVAGWYLLRMQRSYNDWAPGELLFFFCLTVFGSLGVGRLPRRIRQREAFPEIIGV